MYNSGEFQTILLTLPSPKLNSKFSPKRRSQRGQNLVIMQLYNHKIQPQCSIYLMCCILQTIHFPLRNSLQFPMLYHVAGLLVPEGRRGTSWELLGECGFLNPLAIINEGSASHRIPLQIFHFSYFFRPNKRTGWPTGQLGNDMEFDSH
jgi:hypothetical protein